MAECASEIASSKGKKKRSFSMEFKKLLFMLKQIAIDLRHLISMLTKNPFDIVDEDVIAAAPAFNVIEEDDVDDDFDI